MADHLFSFCAFFFSLEVLGDEIKLRVIYSSSLVFRNRQIIEKGGSDLGLFIFVGEQLFLLYNNHFKWK